MTSQMSLRELQLTPKQSVVQFLKDPRTARILTNGLLIVGIAVTVAAVYATNATICKNAAGAVITCPAAASNAGEDFANITGTLRAWTEGSLGNVFALGTLAVGLGMGVVKQTIMPVVVAVGMAAAAKWGPGVLLGISSTLL